MINVNSFPHQVLWNQTNQNQWPSKLNLLCLIWKENSACTDKIKKNLISSSITPYCFNIPVNLTSPLASCRDVPNHVNDTELQPSASALQQRRHLFQYNGCPFCKRRGRKSKFRVQGKNTLLILVPKTCGVVDILNSQLEKEKINYIQDQTELTCLVSCLVVLHLRIT